VLVFHDVTERRRAHVALQKSEALLKISNDELQTQNKALAMRWEEFKHTEAALRESERKFQLIFNQSPVGLILFRLSRCCLGLQSAFRQHIQFSSGKISRNESSG
jgi:PAS domain-containing protein